MEGVRDSTRRKRLKDVSTFFARWLLLATRIFCTDNEAPRPAPPPPRFARCASSSGPPPPLRGGGRWRRSHDASHRSPQNQFANDRMFSLCASFYPLFPISFLPFVISSLKKLRGRSADRRHCPVTAPRKGACCHTPRARGAGAPYGARSPTGAPPRLLHRRTNATAQPQAALPGTRLRSGRYPSPPVPVQRASRRPVVVPAGRLPRAARERLRTPPAGTALAPFQGSSRETPSHERAITP